MDIQADSIRQDFVFVAGRVFRPSTYVFIAHHGPSLDNNTYRAHVLLWEAGVWRNVADFDWQAVDLTVSQSEPLTVLVLGRDGQLGSLEQTKKTEQHLDPKRPLGPMRGIDRIGPAVYAYGMKREIYRCLDHSRWERYNEGMQAPFPSGKVDVAALIKKGIKEMGGINSIAAAPDQVLHAFGMRGEIWQLERDRWQKNDSPTNLMLTDSAVHEDGVITVCGHSGVILQGHGSSWRFFEYEGPDGLDFSAISILNRKIYLADGNSLRTLRGNSLEVVDFGVGQIVPASSLHSAHMRLLSVAGKEVFVTENGENWTSLIPEP
jgi:hypothetical protein